ncbi:DUF3667 domain-containing protein [Muricauda sp. CAU 1633]|uniref:DUF3667 domain-containing protein n=1 Tax=Allomuricauda sp. CAU 1633 TaxID=2816036 RepID=UPI001A8F615C|nr:DUF3667 domain-containing protein [Muricauda sp. CAU 1633]MBO0321892.1 DUF3667 domain-containing protein [Muricauda sp. CAU 1633]
MNCKNCHTSLRSDFSYCPTCGAKVIRKRLTLKNVGQDLSYQVFNLDNKLLKTFRHLFTQPEVVITSYILGTRKKYMNPISYFAIAITFVGVLFFVLRNVYLIDLTPNSITDTEGPNMDYVFDYQGLLMYLIVPMYALMTWFLFFDKKKFNFTEHVVVNTYITGQVSFVQVLICLPLFGLFDVKYDLFTWFFLFLTISYQFYVFKKIYQIGFWSAFLRGFIYLILFAILMMVIGLLIVVVSIATGRISLEEFRA